MNPRKRQAAVRYSFRLSPQQAKLFEGLRGQLHARSDNEVFEYLVTTAAAQRDDLEQLIYTLMGNLSDTLDKRFRALETVEQLHLALTDSFVKYAVTSLPEVPAALLPAARERASRIYQQINQTAAREFHRRRANDSYDPDELGITTDALAPSNTRGAD